MVQLIVSVNSTVPKSTNATPRSMSSAVIGNMYSNEVSVSNIPPTSTVLIMGEAPRNWKPRKVPKPPAKKRS